MFYTRCLSDSLPCGLSINSSCIFNESLFCFCCFADFSDKNSEKGTNVPQQRRRRSAAAESSLMWWNPKCHQIPLSKNVSSIIWRKKKKKNSKSPTKRAQENVRRVHAPQSALQKLQMNRSHSSPNQREALRTRQHRARTG